MHSAPHLLAVLIVVTPRGCNTVHPAFRYLFALTSHHTTKLYGSRSQGGDKLATLLRARGNACDFENAKSVGTLNPARTGTCTPTSSQLISSTETSPSSRPSLDTAEDTLISSSHHDSRHATVVLLLARQHPVLHLQVRLSRACGRCSCVIVLRNCSVLHS